MINTRNTITRQLNSALDDLFNTQYAWSKDYNSSTTPLVNIYETKDGYHLELNAPDRNKEEFKISIDKNILSIGYEVKPTEGKAEHKTIRREFTNGSLRRSFTLDEKTNAESIEAKYENGLLKVFLPKKEEVKVMPKNIQIL